MYVGARYSSIASRSPLDKHDARGGEYCTQRADGERTRLSHLPTFSVFALSVFEHSVPSSPIQRFAETIGACCRE